MSQGAHYDDVALPTFLAGMDFNVPYERTDTGLRQS